MRKQLSCKSTCGGKKKSEISATDAPEEPSSVLSESLDADDVVAFMGVVDAEIVMLFADPSVFGRGIGHQLVSYAIHHLGVRFVEVNEANESGRKFYARQGFVQIARSDTDGFGLPYPILRLELKAPNG